MIDVKAAVKIAKERAEEMLDLRPVRLEEIERDSYKQRDVWSVTLSFPRDPERLSLSAFAQLSIDPVEYKRFLIDSETGDLVAIKLRELTAR